MKIKKLGQSILMVSALALTPVNTAFAQSTHTVQNGEWLWGIASQYGVTADDIKAANGLTSDWIDVGDVLTIPTSGYAENVDTGSNSGSNSSATTGVHVVAAGETLDGIARANGITVAELMAFNGLSSSWIDVGDQLVLYGNASGSTGTATNSDWYDWYGNGYTSGYSYATTYTIQPGDVLVNIASAYGVSVSELMVMNGLTTDWLVAGNTITVPTIGSSSTGSGAPISSNAVDGAHVVQSGDILSSIALTYGVTVEDLRTWNNLSSDWLNVGDVIYLGPTEGPVAAPSVEVSTPESQDEKKEQEASDTEKSTSTTRTIRLSDLPESARPKTHTVQAGDNVWRIAQNYNISADSLRTWNKLENDDLRIGQVLFVSNPALIPDIHEVAEGESLSNIAEIFNTTEALLREWNDLAEGEPEVGKLLVVSNPNPDTHVVEPGQTLQEIADLYSIAIEDLRSWNKIPDNVTIVNGTLIITNPTGTDQAPVDNEITVDEEATSESEPII